MVDVTGKFEGGGGFTASVGQENERPNLIRQTFTLQGMMAVQAYDGTTGWQIQPFGGKKDPELMGEDDLRDLLLAAPAGARTTMGLDPGFRTGVKVAVVDATGGTTLRRSATLPVARR